MYNNDPIIFSVEDWPSYVDDSKEGKYILGTTCCLFLSTRWELFWQWTLPSCFHLTLDISLKHFTPTLGTQLLQDQKHIDLASTCLFLLLWIIATITTLIEMLWSTSQHSTLSFLSRYFDNCQLFDLDTRQCEPHWKHSVKIIKQCDCQYVRDEL